MSKFVDDLKKDIEGMEARHEQHKELRHEKHEMCIRDRFQNLLHELPNFDFVTN